MPLKFKSKAVASSKTEAAAAAQDARGGDIDPREEFAPLRAKLKIGRDSLDDNAIEQSEYYLEACEAHVLAVSQRDAAKENLAVVDARCAQRLRMEWNKNGEKFNETMVGDAVQCDPEHTKAFEHHAHMVKRAAILGGIKESFDQRQKMLRELSTLFVAGYFSRTTSRATQRDMDQGKASAGREAMRQARANGAD